MTEYYIDLGYIDVRNGMLNNFVFDEKGIPYYKYSFGEYYNITFICHYALYNYQLYLKYKDKKKIKYFMHVANWIIRNGKETKDNFTFPYLFKWKNISPPWISALGQGRILSVLSRAYEISRDEKFLLIARKALTPYKLLVNNGGIKSKFPDGNIAFEEYPTNRPKIVLNGFITALVGLYDLSNIAEDSEAAKMFAEGIESLGKNLYRYDCGFWSKYSLSKPIHISSTKYHNYHIMQLWSLYEMTGNNVFKQYSVKWDNYYKGLRSYLFCSLNTICRLTKRLLKMISNI